MDDDEPYPNPALKERQEWSLRPRRSSQESGYAKGDKMEEKSIFIHDFKIKWNPIRFRFFQQRGRPATTASGSM